MMQIQEVYMLSSPPPPPPPSSLSYLKGIISWNKSELFIIMLHLNVLFVETPKLGFSFPAGFTVSIALCFQIENESAE